MGACLWRSQHLPFSKFDLFKLSKADLLLLVEKIILSSSYADLHRFYLNSYCCSWILYSSFPGICLKKLWANDLCFFQTLIHKNATISLVNLKLPFFQKNQWEGCGSQTYPTNKMDWITISKSKDNEIDLEFSFFDTNRLKWNFSFSLETIFHSFKWFHQNYSLLQLNLMSDGEWVYWKHRFIRIEPIVIYLSLKGQLFVDLINIISTYLFH